MITLAEIVMSLEGQPALTNCEGHDPDGHDACDIAPLCRIRSPLHKIREGIWALMERTTLRSLSSPSIPVPLRAPMASANPNEGGSLTA